jgi:hypothetical protein
MTSLHSIRATISTSDQGMENEYDSVSYKVAKSIGSVGRASDEEVEMGADVGNPWQFSRIGKIVKAQETVGLQRGQGLRNARSKVPVKVTPTLMPLSARKPANPVMKMLHRMSSLFSYDTTLVTKGVVMRPESVGSDRLSQDENLQNSYRFGSRDFMSGSVRGEGYHTQETLESDDVMLDNDDELTSFERDIPNWNDDNLDRNISAWDDNDHLDRAEASRDGRGVPVFAKLETF